MLEFDLEMLPHQHRIGSSAGKQGTEKKAVLQQMLTGSDSGKEMFKNAYV